MKYGIFYNYSPKKWKKRKKKLDVPVRSVVL